MRNWSVAFSSNWLFQRLLYIPKLQIVDSVFAPSFKGSRPLVHASTAHAEPLAMWIGVYLLSVGTVCAGVLDLVWRDFDPGHQPFGGLGYYVPDRAILACVTGAWLVLAGSFTLWRGTERMGQFAMAAIYFIIGLLSFPHLYTLLHKYGFHWTLAVGVLGQFFLQLLVVAGCLVLNRPQVQTCWSKTSGQLARWMLGIGGILAGVGHMDNTKGLVHMIPKWMPFAPSIWIVISGIGFILAGAAILTAVLDLLAARLLALMLFLFQIILVPILFEYPHAHQAWGATAFNLAVAGSVCIYAASIAARKAEIAGTVRH